MKVAGHNIVSIIAHDMKDPLSSISGITDILINNWEEFSYDEKVEVLKEIRSMTDNSMTLLNDLLEWSKKTTEISTPEIRSFEAMKVVSDIVEPARRSAKFKNIQIESHLTKEFTIKADVRMFATIIRNLVANAVKSCIDGGLVTISAVRKENDWEFYICDNGKGIPKGRLDYLFTEGVSEEVSAVKGPSNGFGLILCRDFIELNHGRIWAESREGVGTCVHFTLPG